MAAQGRKTSALSNTQPKRLNKKKTPRKTNTIQPIGTLPHQIELPVGLNQLPIDCVNYYIENYIETHFPTANEVWIGKSEVVLHFPYQANPVTIAIHEAPTNRNKKKPNLYQLIGTLPTKIEMPFGHYQLSMEVSNEHVKQHIETHFPKRITDAADCIMIFAYKVALYFPNLFPITIAVLEAPPPPNEPRGHMPVFMQKTWLACNLHKLLRTKHNNFSPTTTSNKPLASKSSGLQLLFAPQTTFSNDTNEPTTTNASTDPESNRTRQSNNSNTTTTCFKTNPPDRARTPTTSTDKHCSATHLSVAYASDRKIGRQGKDLPAPSPPHQEAHPLKHGADQNSEPNRNRPSTTTKTTSFKHQPPDRSDGTTNDLDALLVSRSCPDTSPSKIGVDQAAASTQNQPAPNSSNHNNNNNSCFNTHPPPGPRTTPTQSLGTTRSTTKFTNHLSVSFASDRRIGRERDDPITTALRLSEKPTPTTQVLSDTSELLS